MLVIQVNAQLVFHNPDNFPLLGKISPDTETRYERLPVYLKDVTRPPVWRLGKQTAGLALRFRSNSTQIAAKWEVIYDKVSKKFAPTGIKGLDLYTIENGEWEYVKTAIPTGKINEFVIISNMESKMREYMLFLPLYDGVVKLE
ncbi:MAG: hydrolase, partial [Bacteroidales bacterium]|nr:hydrolase [Bacteroidales bacterium]